MLVLRYIMNRIGWIDLSLLKSRVRWRRLRSFTGSPHTYMIRKLKQNPRGHNVKSPFTAPPGSRDMVQGSWARHHQMRVKTQQSRNYGGIGACPENSAGDMLKQQSNTVCVNHGRLDTL